MIATLALAFVIGYVVGAAREASRYFDDGDDVLPPQSDYQAQQDRMKGAMPFAPMDRSADR